MADAEPPAATDVRAHEVPKPSRDAVLRGVVFMWAALGLWPAAALPEPQFEGRLVVEVVEESDPVWNLRLLEAFAYRDSTGRLWQVPPDARATGALLPDELSRYLGRQPSGHVRRAAVIRDHQVRIQQAQWRDVGRMFHEANRTEGISEQESKIAYMLWYAGGWRWEPRGSSCFRSCHAAAAELAWRPDLDGVDLAPLVHWIWQDNPSLDAIDARVDALLYRPGPHLFTQLKPRSEGPR